MGRAATVPAVSHLGDPAGLRSRRAGASPRRLSEPIGASLRVRPERLAGESFAAWRKAACCPRAISLNVLEQARASHGTARIGAPPRLVVLQARVYAPR